jgi:hypothetical protein
MLIEQLFPSGFRSLHGYTEELAFESQDQYNCPRLARIEAGTLGSLPMRVR